MESPNSDTEDSFKFESSLNQSPQKKQKLASDIVYSGFPLPSPILSPPAFSPIFKNDDGEEFMDDLFVVDDDLTNADERNVHHFVFDNKLDNSNNNVGSDVVDNKFNPMDLLSISVMTTGGYFIKYDPVFNEPEFYELYKQVSKDEVDKSVLFIDFDLLSISKTYKPPLGFETIYAKYIAKVQNVFGESFTENKSILLHESSDANRSQISILAEKKDDRDTVTTEENMEDEVFFKALGIKYSGNLHCLNIANAMPKEFEFANRLATLISNCNEENELLHLATVKPKFRSLFYSIKDNEWHFGKGRFWRALFV